MRSPLPPPREPASRYVEAKSFAGLRLRLHSARIEFARSWNASNPTLPCPTLMLLLLLLILLRTERPKGDDGERGGRDLHWITPVASLFVVLVFLGEKSRLQETALLIDVARSVSS